MNIVHFISTYAIESIIVTLALCLGWTHYWTRHTKRRLNEFQGELLASHANLRSEVRDLRRRLTDDTSPYKNSQINLGDHPFGNKAP